MIFRDGKFRVEFGDFYDEMNKLDTESRYSTFSNVMGYCLDWYNAGKCFNGLLLNIFI